MSNRTRLDLDLDKDLIISILESLILELLDDANVESFRKSLSAIHCDEYDAFSIQFIGSYAQLNPNCHGILIRNILGSICLEASPIILEDFNHYLDTDAIERPEEAFTLALLSSWIERAITWKMNSEQELIP